MKCSREKETAVAVFESSADKSNEENGNEIEECDDEIKLFKGTASNPRLSKSKRSIRTL